MGTLRSQGRPTAGGEGMNLNSVSAFTFAAQAFVTLFVIMDPPGATPVSQAFSMASGVRFIFSYCSFCTLWPFHT